MVRDLPDSAGGILSYFTRHKTLANLLLVVLLMAGVVALPKMRAQFFPDVVVDSINISVAWNGAGAEDVDQGIVKVWNLPYWRLKVCPVPVADQPKGAPAYRSSLILIGICPAQMRM